MSWVFLLFIDDSLLIFWFIFFDSSIELLNVLLDNGVLGISICFFFSSLINIGLNAIGFKKSDSRQLDSKLFIVFLYLVFQFLSLFGIQELFTWNPRFI